MTLNVTVILCTYNRSDSLAKALQSLAESEMPDTAKWEVLVVDNNSQDRTRAVVEEYGLKYPGRFCYLFEPQQGKSHALNLGVQQARGEILAFVDDDVIVEPTWLHNLTSVLQNGKWSGAGGRILPAREFVPPGWLADEGPLCMIGALCAYSDQGDAPGELKTPVVGANMAIRREMFERYGSFRTDLGPRPGSEVRHEDTEFSDRMTKGGERLRYVPSAIVYHVIHEGRVRKAFFLDWYFDFGRGSVRQAEKNLSATETLKAAARVALTALQWLITINSQLRFYRKCWTWLYTGKIVECCHRAKQERASGPAKKGRLEEA